MSVQEIHTERLILRRWRDADRVPFAALNADPEVMASIASVGEQHAGASSTRGTT